jgi:hypothetical protein
MYRIHIYNIYMICIYWCLERLRRDGACENGVLQQRAAGEAPLDEAAHVCVLIHVGATQARTPGRQDRPLVSLAVQVKDGCDLMPYMYMYIYSCFTPALLLLVFLCVYIYALLRLYSGLTYNIYDICNIGIYSCL